MAVTLYATAAEMREYTGVSTYDWTDAAITDMIEAATTQIDIKTGRTWQEITTITDEVYTGDFGTTMMLYNVDLTALDALSINTSPTGSTFTDITTSKVRFKEGLGILDLQPDAEVNYFPNYTNSIKVSYKYGAAAAPEDIRLACRYLTAYMMKSDFEIHKEFDIIINQYKINRYRIV